MARQILKDNHSRVIGFIDTKPDGSQVIMDEHHSIKGFYNPKTNKTMDKHHSIIGTGNLLTTLLD